MEKNIKTTVKKWGINGEGIAFYRHKPVFIPEAIPQEIIRFHFTEEKQAYGLAEIDEILKPSALRRARPCRIEGCDGCALMHVKYKGQCRMKELILKQTLQRYADLQVPIQPIIKNENVFGYRNSCKMPVKQIDGKLRMGLYLSRSNRFLPVSRCIVHDKELERVRQQVEQILNTFHKKAYDKHSKTGIRTVVLKSFENCVQLTLVTGQETLDADCIEALSQIESVVSLWQSIKTDQSIDVFGPEMIHLAGQKHMVLHVHDVTLQLLPRSFFQLNTQQAIRLYDYVVSLIQPCDFLVEAYSGIGAMSLLTAHKVKKILGIEYIEDAVENANENARINQMTNVSFVCDDSSSRLKTIKEPIDCLIVDPPRSGLGESMVQAILQKQPKQFIYVSCNPSTLAKDLHLLQKEYHVDVIQPFDMFSQTQHVETVALLTR